MTYTKYKFIDGTNLSSEVIQEIYMNSKVIPIMPLKPNLNINRFMLSNNLLLNIKTFIIMLYAKSMKTAKRNF